MKHPSNCVRTADTFINNDYAQQSGIHRFAKERAIVAVNFTRPIQLVTIPDGPPPIERADK